MLPSAHLHLAEHNTPRVMFSNVVPSRGTAAGLFPGTKLAANRNHYDPDFQAVVFCGYGESCVRAMPE